MRPAQSKDLQFGNPISATTPRNTNSAGSAYFSHNGMAGPAGDPASGKLPSAL
jgi:hypothetical protein